MPKALLRRALVLFTLSLPSATSGATGLRRVASTAEVESGTFLLRDAEGYLAAPAVSTEVMIRITGLVARTEVIQRYMNPTDDTVGGLYAFPLPPGAAVDRLRLEIGERSIEGKLMERAQAERAFETAQARGQRASLLRQERPNLFSTSVANLGPKETLVVRLEYQETVQYDAGAMSLRFPLRTNPGHYRAGAEISDFAASGFATPAATRPLPDSTVSTSPISLRVSLEPGFELAGLHSSSHLLRVQAEGRVHTIELQSRQVTPDRDFVLSWRPRLEEAPKAALFSELRGEHRYVLLMVVPPHAAKVQDTQLPKETVFIIDTSCSMAGESMPQAKTALQLAVSRLRPEDVFNIIEFNSDARTLWTEAREAQVAAQEEAGRFIDRLQPTGGTNMLSALKLALPEQERATDRLRQVIFVTDGAVDNEEQLFHFIKARLGRSRLFTVGIGSAPNSWFMREAAQFGQGTLTQINRLTEVQEKMAGLFAKIESPVVRDLSFDFGVTGSEAWPDRVPDLYLGEPIVLTARVPADAKRMELRGRTKDEPFTLSLPLVGGAEERGIAKLWARSKIEALTDRIVMGTPELELRPELVRVALQYGLVSTYTSLVAIEDTREVATAAASDPTEDPYAEVLPSGGTASRLLFSLSIFSLLLGLGFELAARRRAVSRARS